MKLTKEERRAEQETIIRFDETEDGQAEIYTPSKIRQGVLERAGCQPDEQLGEAKVYLMHRSAIQLKPGKRAIKIGGTRR